MSKVVGKTNREKGKVVDLQLDWQREPSMRITRKGHRDDDLHVVVDPRLSITQVSEACRQLGDIGWQVLGAWCSIMRPSLSPRSAPSDEAAALGIVTPDRVIRWISPQVESLLGWPSQALIGQPVPQLVHPEQERLADALRESAGTHGQAQGRFLVRTADGGYRAVHSQGTTICKASGEPAFILGEWRPEQQANGDLRAAALFEEVLGNNAA